MYKRLSLLLIFLFLALAIIQVVFFLNTFNLYQNQINTRFQLALNQTEQLIEQHEINRHKDIFNQYKDSFLCLPNATNSHIDLTFRINNKDTFNNLQDLGNIILKKLNKQALSSGKFMLNKMPIDTAFIDSTLNVQLLQIETDLGFKYNLLSKVDNVISSKQYQMLLFDDYRFYAPLYLVVEVYGLKTLLFKNIALILFSAFLSLILIFIATRYTYLTLLKYKNIAESKAAFINHLAHEIKTPLSCIYISTEALLDVRINKNENVVAQYATVIHFEAEKLARQLENVLHVSANEKHFLQLNKTLENPNELIKKVVLLFEKRVNDMGGGINFTIANATLKVNIDSIHFGNALYNLIDNAIKYSGFKKLRVNIETYCTPTHFILQIADEGIGIKAENLPHIFTLFYKINNNINGFGVGLNYVKTIINKHDGNINVKSKPNVGTTFTISIPLQK